MISSPLLKKVRHYARKAVTLPPHVVVRKAYRLASAAVRSKVMRKLDLCRARPSVQISLGNPLFDVSMLPVDDKELAFLSRVCPMYMEHRFDLLGSGWVKWDGQGPFLGVEGHVYSYDAVDASISLPPAHSGECIRLRSLIRDPHYSFIDWQRDVKSGFRYNDKAWHLDQPVGLHRGVDIKVPWEIGRLQHLPQMGVEAIRLKSLDAGKSRQYTQEFRSQLLDFISANPVRVGAQWTCTMDVGIRAANIAMTYTLFQSLGENDILDAEFEHEIAVSLYRHCEHIVSALEWSEELTSNHYLANVCGLLFASMALESTPVTNTWLAFAIEQLTKEINKQFYADGANFEASLSYHRLSLEMVVYSVALVCGIPQERLKSLQSLAKRCLPSVPKMDLEQWRITCGKAIEACSGSSFFTSSVLEKLARGSILTVIATKPDNCIAQIGDNDSGRFFRFTAAGTLLSPVEAEKKYHNLSGYCSIASSYETSNNLYFDENMLDHRGVVGAARGLFPFESLKCGFRFEERLVRAMLREHCLGISESELSLLKPELRSAPVLLGGASETVLFEDGGEQSQCLTDGGSWTYYPDAGWYIYRSDRVFLFVNAGPNGQNGNGGHCHNDKLSMELQIDGIDILRDPGTGLYTPIPEMRNAYRSAAAHFVPASLDGEQNRFEADGLFWMHEDTDCWVCDYGESSIIVAMEIKKKQMVCIRKVTVEDYRIVIGDTIAPEVTAANFLGISSGYGKILRGD
ncbi:heparinase II/III family protein [Oleidesulfovibrio sp.]|uniref:heparinase II/III family protein n=1 Tax=Oleidesulfovibrio sp. TaxID=2909707 RepID=UPI003A8B4003